MPTLYYTNATNGTLSDKQVKKMAAHARAILLKNGVEVAFQLISIQKAKSQEYWAYGDMFLAIVNVENTISPSLSRIDEEGGGMVEGFGNQTSYTEYTPEGYSSFVSYAAIRKTNYKGDPYYYMGYQMAHEVLHQLLGYSGVKANHTNHINNLNTDGKYTTIPLGASNKLRDFERILPEHLTAINNYLIKRP